MAKNKPLISFMSDDEFIEYKQQEEKRKFLEDLQNSSRQGITSFSVKQLKNKPKDETVEEDEKSEITSLEDVIQTTDSVRVIPDNIWETMLEQFEEMDPIDEISDTGRFLYRRRDTDDVSNQFKNELSILHDLLKQSKTYGKMVEKRITARDAAMKKGKSAGIGKYDIELFEISNNMISTQLSITAKMADIRTKIEDIKLKQLKNNPPEDTSNETLANQYYAQLMGNRGAFITAMNGGVNDSLIQTTDNMISSNVSRSITDPIESGYEQDIYEEEYDDADPYKYIENESRDVNICVQVFSDGDREFVAIDGTGEVVSNYALPDESLLQSLKFPMNSSYCSDTYGRRYKIIHIDENNYFEVDNED